MEDEEMPSGWAGVLLVGVDNFFEFDIRFRLVALSITVGFIMTMSCIYEGWWSRSDTTRFGFLNHCFIGSPYTCCESFEDFLGNKPGWLKAALAFTCIAFIFSCTTFVFIICSMCVSKSKKTTRFMIHRVIPVFCFITGLMLLISVSIISDNHHKETWSEQNNVSRTFNIAVVCLVSFLLDGGYLLYLAKNHVEDAIYPPGYWTKFTKETTIKEWIAKSHKKVEFVNVSGAEMEIVKHLIKKTWKSNLAGRGRDALASGYKEMKVMDVQRVENPTVYEKYAENKQKLLRRVGTAGTLKRLEEIPECNAIETVSYIPNGKDIFNDTNPEINEHYLFHGANNDAIDGIAEDGFDTRLAEYGMYGRGTYAAECPTKSDHYAGSELYNCKMILLRILLGEMYVTSVNCPKQRRPPCKTCVKNGIQDLLQCNDSSHHMQKDWMFDSVVGAIPGKHREFIVYDQHMCYPEYIITYNRI